MLTAQEPGDGPGTRQHQHQGLGSRPGLLPRQRLPRARSLEAPAKSPPPISPILMRRIGQGLARGEHAGETAGGEPRARCEPSFWVTSLQSARPLGELGNGQADGLGSRAVHGSLSEPEADVREGTRGLQPCPSPESPPEAQSRPYTCPGRSPPWARAHAVTRHRGWNKAGILANRRRAPHPRNKEPWRGDSFLSRSPQETPGSSPAPLPSPATPYPTCQDGWGLLPSSPAPPSLLSDGDRLRGPGA